MDEMTEQFNIDIEQEGKSIKSCCTIQLSYTECDSV